MTQPDKLSMALDNIHDALYWLEEYDRTHDADAFDNALRYMNMANRQLDIIAGAIE